MISAVILVTTDSGAQDKVLENIKLVEGVEEAHALYGVYDLLIKINGNSARQISRYSNLHSLLTEFAF